MEESAKTLLKYRPTVSKTGKYTIIDFREDQMEEDSDDLIEEVARPETNEQYFQGFLYQKFSGTDKSMKAAEEKKGQLAEILRMGNANGSDELDKISSRLCSKESSDAFTWKEATLLKSKLESLLANLQSFLADDEGNSYYQTVWYHKRKANICLQEMSDMLHFPSEQQAGIMEHQNDTTGALASVSFFYFNVIFGNHQTRPKSQFCIQLVYEPHFGI